MPSHPSDVARSTPLRMRHHDTISRAPRPRIYVRPALTAPANGPLLAAEDRTERLFFRTTPRRRHHAVDRRAQLSGAQQHDGDEAWRFGALLSLERRPTRGRRYLQGGTRS